MNRIILLVTAAVMLAALPGSAGASVTWTFYETGSYCVGSCSPVQPGYAIASLILPSSTSSGSASYYNPDICSLIPPVGCSPGSLSTTGDGTDFSFSLFGEPQLSPSDLEPSSGDGPVSYDFVWSGGGPVSISYQRGADYQFDYNRPADLSIANVDDYLGFPGCIPNTQCFIAGFWTDLPVPEPMSISMLASGLAIFAAACFGFRRRSGASAK